MTSPTEPVTVHRGTHRVTQAVAYDAEATHYLRRADQEQSAYGPGFYPNLLRAMAAERTVMAEQLRAMNGAAT